ncbi:unnamed protein product [Symbiodinium microadriaticum]|nr:unnamed protein product [Symbiodinium microadriaticum]
MQKDVRATLVDDRDGRFGPLARKLALLLGSLGLGHFAGFVSAPSGKSTAPRAPRAATETPEPKISEGISPVLTYLGINSMSLEIGEQRLLIDPLLVGSLVFFGQRWAFRGRSRAEAVPKPEDVAESFDAIVLTQGLDDHTHRPTLERVDRRMPIIANPSAASVVRAMGFQDVSVLRPDESLSRGSLRLTAVPGSVVGPPWQDPENGYVFTDTRPGGLSVGLEPHGNFLGPALGTSFQRLPTPPAQSVDALILPLTSQVISGYRLVNGVEEAANTLEALTPVPRYLLPLRNGELDAEGVLAESLQKEGGVQDFLRLQGERPKLSSVELLDVTPGHPLQIRSQRNVKMPAAS